MDPLRLSIAIIPLATYLLVIGVINLRQRALIVSGSGDAATLAAALSGLVVIGPLELFMPLAAAARFGWLVWLFLLTFYWLCASLAILMMRPRLVIYNTTLDAMRPVLSGVVSQLDPSSRWAGRNVAMPGLGIEFHLEAVEFLRNVSLVGTGQEQNLPAWKRFERALRPALVPNPGPRGARGVFFVGCALIMLAAVVSQMLLDPQAVALAVAQMLRP